MPLGASLLSQSLSPSVPAANSGLSDAACVPKPQTLCSTTLSTLSPDPAAWLNPALRAQASCAFPQGPPLCPQHGRASPALQGSLGPSTSSKLAPGRPQVSWTPQGLKFSRAPQSWLRIIHSTPTCKTGKVNSVRMDSVRGGPSIFSVVCVKFWGQSHMLKHAGCVATVRQSLCGAARRHDCQVPLASLLCSRS